MSAVDKREVKACKVCRRPFARRPPKAGRNLEAITVFRKRECCSKSCAAILRERRYFAGESEHHGPTPE
jgi:hypothetical protein